MYNTLQGSFSASTTIIDGSYKDYHLVRNFGITIPIFYCFIKSVNMDFFFIQCCNIKRTITPTRDNNNHKDKNSQFLILFSLKNTWKRQKITLLNWIKYRMEKWSSKEKRSSIHSQEIILLSSKLSLLPHDRNTPI